MCIYVKAVTVEAPARCMTVMMQLRIFSLLFLCLLLYFHVFHIPIIASLRDNNGINDDDNI